MRLDTIATLQEELAGYKRQLANSYLMDKEVMNHLLKELYQRTKEDIKIAHIYVVANDKSTPSEKAEALNKINAAKSKLDGGTSWDKVVSEYSMDKNNNNEGGVLGYFTAMLPAGYHELENAMYNTSVGKYSDVIKTNIGYHIVKVIEKRPARGKVKIAHILIRENNSQAEEIINQIYSDLISGASFEALVEQYSEDAKSKSNKGILPDLGINQTELTFEEAAFGLDKDGAFSKPVQTKIGWHIIQRVSKEERPDFNTFRKIHEAKIKKDDRYEEARLSLIKDIKTSSNFNLDQKLFNSFAASLDSSFLTYKWGDEVPLEGNKTLFSFGGDVKYSLADFTIFCKKNTRTRLKFDKTEKSSADVAQILLDDYINEKAIDYEQSNLEKKYSDFKSLMREYEEGILLFEVTKNEVWDKANEDTLGLEQYYELNKKKYMSEQRADLQMVFIATEDIKKAEKVYQYYQDKGLEKTQKKFNKKEELVSSFTEKLDRSNNNFGGIQWESGAISPLEFDNKAKRYVFKKIVNTYEPMPKTIKEARGYIVADYQDYLETEWVKTLKKSYKVDLNREVINSIIK